MQLAQSVQRLEPVALLAQMRASLYQTPQGPSNPSKKCQRF